MGYLDNIGLARVWKKIETLFSQAQKQIDTLNSVALIGHDTINGAKTGLDTITASGIYKYYNKPAGTPTGNYGLLFVLNPKNQPPQTSDTYVIQIAFCDIAVTTFNGNIYVRSSANGGLTWSNWFRLSSAEVIAQTT